MLVALFSVVIFTACDKEDEYIFDTKGATVAISNAAGFFDLGDLNSTFSFDASSLGEAVSSFDILKSYNGGTPVFHATVNSLPTSVSITPTEAVEGLGVTVDDLQIGDEISFSFDNVVTSSGSYPSSASVTGSVSCLSALAGTFDYTTSETWCGSAPFTGQTTWTEVSPGTYEIDDWSYGAYPDCYGGFMASSWGTLQITDVCNQIGLTGLDNYGDTWTLSNLSVDGADFTYSWSNTYGEGGTTTLTRTDGTEWPALYQ